ncbi:MAG TPA: holo-ACP synthase [Rhodanobacter sp.]|nr:holo-ACP synthase [Rhodanobacter sp.]HEV2740736.1 holo-ACP synthase [Candidatus Elarobacter sp.]
MSIVGHGIDMVPIEEIRRLVSSADGHFIVQCFTESEREDSGTGSNQPERLAGRFAAKEAVAKALGVGWGDGVAWTDIEILSRESGAPFVELHSLVELVADALGIRRWLLSITHSDEYALASVIALSDCES